MRYEYHNIGGTATSKSKSNLKDIINSGYDFAHGYGELNSILDNYIYLYHTGEFLILPTYPDTIQDTMSSTFAQTNALSRSAPVFSYSNSGPRTINVQISLFRDVVDEANVNADGMETEVGEDYTEALIRKLQSIALPRYTENTKGVIPPMVALRCGNEIFIKGVVNGQVSVGYSKPILADGRYAQVAISFPIYEVDPYDADSVAELGSFRGITKAFADGKFGDGD